MTRLEFEIARLEQWLTEHLFDEALEPGVWDGCALRLFMLKKEAQGASA